MAQTLTEHLKTTRDNLKAGVLDTLLRRTDLMQIVPWENIGTLSVKVTRRKTLPTVAWRQLNAAHSESTGKTEQLDETVYSVGGDIDIDKAFMKDTKAMPNPRTLQVEMKLEALAFEMNDTVINGDQATDANQPNGMKKRVGNLPTAQSVSVGTNGLDVRASTANMYTFIDKMNAAAYRIDGGWKNVSAVLCNDTSFLAVTSVLTRLKLLGEHVDMFGKTFTTWGTNGPRIIDVGYTDESEGTRIITDTETEGSSTDCTSIYLARFGDGGEYFHGIEEYSFDVENIGWLESKPVYRIRLDWMCGFALFNDRSLVRVKGVRWTTV